MSAVLEVIEGGVIGEGAVLRQGYVAQLSEAWHSTRAKIMFLGETLIEAKLKLPHGEFQAMIREDLPFSPDHASRFMRIAADLRLSNPASKQHLPEAIEALDNLRKLSDEQYEAAIARGAIHENMTVKDAVVLVRELRREKATAYVHRPISSQTPAPSPPAGPGAISYGELVWMLAKERKAQGVSQASLDDMIGWGDGQTSKYEIPHQDDGRVASWDKLSEWLQALGLRISLVPAK